MKIIASLLSLGLLFVSSTLTFIFGWGLEVKSWGWVIGGWVFIVFVGVIQAALDE